MSVKPKKPTPKKLAGTHVKFSFRRHILPVLAGLVVFASIFGFFNSELLSGQIAYYFYSRHIDTSHLDSQTTTFPVDKNAAPRIIINQIDVNAPVNFNETHVNEWDFLVDLRSAVVHFPGTALPGQVGNVVIFGHSSGQWWAPGQYKYVFTLLDKLGYDDKIFIEYKGVRYIYSVDDVKVIDPSNLSVLNQGGEHLLTLITCTPVGTDTNRLVIHANQISPRVSEGTDFSKPAVAPATIKGQDVLPGTPSFWQDFTDLLGGLFKH